MTAKAPRPDAGPAERLERALELAYRHLARRDRTVLEVRRHLVSRGVDEDTVEAALAELAVQGYLDDARYAARFAEDRRSIDAWGGERIARGLLDAGVAREHVEAALRDREEEAEELEAAVAVLRRRLPEPPSTDRARERALGLLVRRGYELELAYEAVRAFERHAA